jgi:hypothetical protein
MEQSVVIKFDIKSGKTATEMQQEPKNMYGDDCLSRAEVFRWSARF